MSNSTSQGKYKNDLGLYCPYGGDLYVCEGTWKEFVGCCTSDPCSRRDGACPQNDLRSMAFNADHYESFPVQDCDDDHGDAYWYTCIGIKPTFAGCCRMMPCLELGCSEDRLVPAMLAGSFANRDMFLDQYRVRTLTKNPTSTPPSPNSFSQEQTGDWGQLGPGDVAGIFAGVAVIATVFAIFLWKYSWLPNKGDRPAKHPNQLDSLGFSRGENKEYQPVDTEPPPQDIFKSTKAELSGDETCGTSTKQLCSPRELHSRDYGWYLEWTWDIILTIIPLFFIVLPILILRLDAKPPSEAGKRVSEITRIGPTLYPIIFAAIASRFYKNVARWRLEGPEGIRLATLEQVFGSQSFAGAFERLLFVRTEVPIGLAVLLIWSMSPLGGQGTIRLLSVRNQTLSSDADIYYVHPSYQTSAYCCYLSTNSAMGGTNALYSASLLSSETQKLSARDPWELPKIPQWQGSETESFYDIYDTSEEVYYTSLLGIKIQGLHSTPSPGTHLSHSFTIETSYLDFNCASIDFPLDAYGAYSKSYSFKNDLDLSMLYDTGFVANITNQARVFMGRTNFTKTTSPYLLYAIGSYTMGEEGSGDYFNATLFNCTMSPLVLETEIQCIQSVSTTNCTVQRQRRVNRPAPASKLLDLVMMTPPALESFFFLWPSADGSKYNQTGWLPFTVNYLAGEPNPFAGQTKKNISSIGLRTFSRRLTTVFNTYHMATLDPFGHTNVSFNYIPETNSLERPNPIAPPFLNATRAQITAKNEVYYANRFWITIVLLTTFILELMAMIGLFLRCIIRGPDVIGFASSFTRENKYIPVPLGGTGLDGPERARLLGDIRVQLADVRPKDDIGYITMRAVQHAPHEQCEGDPYDVGWRPLVRRRAYI